MSTMNAALLKGLEMPLEITGLPVPIPDINQTIVQLKAAALNKRDYWITKGKYPRLVFPLVPGSDGVGLIESREVIINPGIDWGNNPNLFDPAFRILGMPEYGTFAESIVVPSTNIYDKPSHLSWIEAAALPVCGVTAYRAMFTRGKATQDDRMLITGVGGGVATLALLFGVAIGMEVWVTSSSEEKIKLAKQHGSSGGINYTSPDWEKTLEEKAGRFDLVIDGAGGNDFSRMVQIMNPGGRMVMYGGTSGNINGLSPQRIFWKQLDILGSTMGSPEDFKNMIDLVNQYKIKPIVSHVFPLRNINDAMDVIAKGKQFGKICIDITGD
ncbi:MAG TPA: zinc-binding dehydrogenase [Saprospiraceae bacterium]|nr:zinc-binding dehydrogenase [Saprospiraceae bacterium]